MKNKFLYILFVVFGVLVLLYVFFSGISFQNTEITSFEECATSGNPVMESYPRQCRTADGVLFVEKITEETQIPPVEKLSDNRAQRTSGAYDECIITGCSSQVCAGEQIITTCEFKEEYACFKGAVCERNTNDTCGWRQTENLLVCLK